MKRLVRSSSGMKFNLFLSATINTTLDRPPPYVVFRSPSIVVLQAASLVPAHSRNRWARARWDNHSIRRFPVNSFPRKDGKKKALERGFHSEASR
uniref:Uncharacterized protein n=1 Tax=Picea glauca TaxID=3330 RepID=A0A101M0P1_PICGL|nr:hypothetical protein ABT39_MTgene4103 [Picea glauca]QHR92549.1 hypothetical protein Q903MT_gene6595 [Picea sitchensis]